jgi:hypothetical protein
MLTPEPKDEHATAGVYRSCCRCSDVAVGGAGTAAGEAGHQPIQQRHSGGQAKNLTAFRQGLKEAGFVEGQNVAIEFRWGENQFDLLPALATDVIARKPAVMLLPRSKMPGLTASPF